MNNYDAIIIGAGHNGLVCAAYLARAGIKVLCLESAESAGGMSAPRTIAEHYHFPGLAHAAYPMSRALRRDLRLDKFDDLAIAQTSVAGIAGIIIRDDRGGQLAYHMLCDSASAAYLWDCLVDAMTEFDGRPVGLAAVRALGGA